MAVFPVLMLLARPAAGKSEVINYLKNLDPEERSSRFHIGSMHEIDDFPMLWTWFEEDHILEEMGYPRLHTDNEGYFKEPYLWNVLIRRISLEYQKLTRDVAGDETVVIEFSRGVEHGGFREACAHLSEEVLEQACVLYIDVSYEESVRKNSKRFNPSRPDSILEHGLPADKMERLYRDSDWQQFCSGDSRVLSIKSKSVPYMVFENEDDVTTLGGEALGKRLERCLNDLWTLSESRGT